MKRIVRLQIAALILFWFGVIAEIFILAGSASEYDRLGTIQGRTLELIFFDMFTGTVYFTYTLFAHFVHILSGYWLAKGTKKGIILGISLGLYEIVSFFLPDLNPDLFSPTGIAYRIMFGIVVIFIISGRTARLDLYSSNWRPWKRLKIL